MIDPSSKNVVALSKLLYFSMELSLLAAASFSVVDAALSAEFAGLWQLREFCALRGVYTHYGVYGRGYSLAFCVSSGACVQGDGSQDLRQSSRLDGDCMRLGQGGRVWV